MLKIKKFKKFVITEIGINPKRIICFVIRIPIFINEFLRFMKTTNSYQKKKIKIYPCLHDKGSQLSILKDEYFLQDLYCSKLIQKLDGSLHLDIGSRVDGFITQISSCKNVISLDYRQHSERLFNIQFESANLLEINTIRKYILPNLDSLSSISCLHTLEHIGLGRYGDPIGFNYLEIAISNLLKVTPKNIPLFLSMPTGKEQVIFNAFRVINPKYLVQIFQKYNMKLKNIVFINNGILDVQGSSNEQKLLNISKYDYVLSLMMLINEEN